MSSDDFFEHFGIKGMKWGVRRENPSGVGSKRATSKHAETMSDDELKKTIARMNLEKQYTDLVQQKQVRDRTKMQAGKAVVSKTVGNVATQTLNEVTKQGANKLIDVITPVLVTAVKTSAIKVAARKAAGG